jgi:hypothetical protein
MDNNKTASFVNDMWDSSIIPELSEYIKHPNKSPHFDPDWEKNGHMEKAVQQFDAWVATQPVKGMTHEIVRIDGRTPLLFIDIPGDSDDVVLLYGHYDKQPEFSGWADDLDPWVGRRPRSLGTHDKGRQVVWSWRRRRRLCGIRIVDRGACIAGTGHSSRPLRRADRRM